MNRFLALLWYPGAIGLRCLMQVIDEDITLLERILYISGAVFLFPFSMFNLITAAIWTHTANFRESIKEVINSIGNKNE